MVDYQDEMIQSANFRNFAIVELIRQTQQKIYHFLMDQLLLPTVES